MKSKYTAPKVSLYGRIDNLTRYIGPSPTNDSFVLNGSLVPADGSTGILNK